MFTGGSCYLTFDQQVTQSEAVSLCKSHRGHIVSVDSAEETALVNAAAQGRYLIRLDAFLNLQAMIMIFQ